MRPIDADEMAMNESEAYMNAQVGEKVNSITRSINTIVHQKIQALIADTPTIDAVPVVRCKDCKRFTACGDSYVCGHALPTKPLSQYLLYGTDILAEVKPDDFCSYGERKDG